MTDNEHGSVIVVGAGIFGTAAALELRKRGHNVTLLDPGPVPHVLASSTDISKALRMDYGADEFYMELMELAFEGWDEWNRAWGVPLFHETGILMFSADPMAPGGFEHDSFELLKARGHSPERLTVKDVNARFPSWEPSAFSEGYFNPRGGWAESGEVVANLISEAKTRGVEIRGDTTCAGLLEKGSRVAGVRTNQGDEFLADSVVLAIGAWTPSMLPQMRDLMWSVGQPVFHFRVEDVAAYQPPDFGVWTADIANTGWYGFPALDDGTLKIANHGPGARQPAAAPRELDPEIEQQFRSFIRSALPGLADAPVISKRMCMYCDTWDGDFWIDRDPAREGLVVAAGGSGHGFKFAPVLGPIIADVVEGKPNRFSPRFQWRERGEVKTEHARYSE